MHGVALLLASAAGAALLARRFHLPLVPLLVAFGTILGLTHPPDAEFLETALILGVSFLLFVAGLELDPRRARAQRRAALQVGIIQFLLLAVAGWGVARGLGLSPADAVWIGLAMPASSTLIGVRLLQRRRQLFEPFGRLTLGTLLVQDALILLALPVAVGLIQGRGAALTGGAGVLLLGTAALLIRRWAGGVLVRFMDEHEVVLLGALALLFIFIGASAALGLPIVVGAFLAGVSLSRFPVAGIVRAEVAPIGDFFTAIFFTALGALIRIPTPAELGVALLLAATVVVVTPPLVMFLAERSGFTSKPAAEAGLLLAQTSEISLVVVLAARADGLAGESVFVVVGLVTVSTMLLTPLLATDEWARRLARVGRRGTRGRPAPPPRDHILLLGAGSTGMPLLEDLILSGCTIVVVDDDPAVCRRLEEAGVRVIRGEASDPAVLRAAGAHQARAVSSTIRRPRDNAALLEVARDVPVLVRVFEEEDARWVRERGGEPVLYSSATADGLMEWFEVNREELEGRSGAGGQAGSRLVDPDPHPTRA